MRRSRQAIEQELRSRIQAGIYPTGSRMPSHRQLQDELQVSSVTLQRAFDRLVEQGYVAERGTHGTHVADRLPTNTFVALLFAEQVGQGAWNSHWSTIKRVAENWDKGPFRVRIYHLTNQRSESEGHRRLCRDLADGGLAGVMMVSSPHYLGNSPLFRSTVPRVLLGGTATPALRAKYGCSAVESSAPELLPTLLKQFAGNHRRRLASIGGKPTVVTDLAACLPLLRSLGMETRPEWWLGLPVNPPGVDCARAVARLLCSGPAAQRPDCLLLVDDNQVPHATAGIVDAGLRPGDIEIAAHANFPAPTRTHMPCTRFGPDIAAQFATALDELALLAGGGPQRTVHVPLRIQRDAESAAIQPGATG